MKKTEKAFIVVAGLLRYLRWLLIENKMWLNLKPTVYGHPPIQWKMRLEK